MQELVLDVRYLQDPAYQFRNLHGSSTNEYGSSCFSELYNIIYRCVELLSHRLVNEVVIILADRGFIRWNSNNIQLIDIPQFSSFRNRSSGHSRKLMIHPKVILKSYRCIRLSSVLHLYIFLRFNRLVKSIGISSSFHHTASLLIYNFNFSINDDVLNIFLEKCIRLEQLAHAMYPLRFDLIIANDLFFPVESCCLIHRFIFLNLVEFCAYFREDEEPGIFTFACDQVNTFFRKVYAIILFFDNEVKWFIGLWHIPLVIS